jgi:hypothetical protein
MPNVQQMPALQSHSWCHLKKDGRLRLRYHHTTTNNKDHDDLKTSMALISVISEKPENVAHFPFFPPEIGQRADLPLVPTIT